MIMVSGGRCPPHGDWIACLWTPRTPSPITIGGLVDGARPGVGGRRGRRVGRLYRVYMDMCGVARRPQDDCLSEFRGRRQGARGLGFGRSDSKSDDGTQAT